MEIAKLFASVGFKVDKTGLDEFRKDIAGLKINLKESAIQTGKLKNQLTGLTAQFKAFQKMTDTKGITKWMDGIEKSVVHLNNMQVAVGRQAQRSTHWADQFSASLLKLHNAIVGRKNEVAEYAQAIMMLAASFERLKAATAGVSRFRQVPSSAISQNSGQWGGSRQGGGRGGTNDNQYIGYWGRAEGMAKSPFAAFIRPMLPTGMGLFNAVAGGYAFKELVKTGREMMALELKMKAVSDNSEQFKKNMEFVRNTSHEMGLDIQQVGDSFANIFVAAKEKLSPQALQDMFKGFSKYYTAVHMTAEDQRLANLAIQQMFGKDKIQAQEARLQMGQRVTPFMKILTKVASENIKGFTTLDDVMKKGLLDPAKLLPLVAKELEKIAETGGAYEEALKNSQVAQIRFNNAMKAFSVLVMKSGLDHGLAILFTNLAKLAEVTGKVIVKVIDFTKVLWENKNLLLLLSGFVLPKIIEMMALFGFKVLLSGIRLWSLAAAAGGAAGMLGSLRVAILGVKMAFGLLLFVLDSVYNYMNGEDNWVHATVLQMEWLELKFTGALMKMQVAWNNFKLTMRDGSISDIATSGFEGLRSIPGVGIPFDAMKGVYDWFQNNPITFDSDPNGLYKNLPVPLKQANPQSMNFEINFNNMPPSTQDALKRGDMREFGKGIGEGISLGGLQWLS